MDIRQPSKPTTFSEVHEIVAFFISLFSPLIFPTITSILLKTPGEKINSFGFGIIILSLIIGLINSIITYKTDGDWIMTKIISVLTSPITLFKDLIMQPIMNRKKIKYKSIEKIGQFILNDLDIFKKFPNNEKKIVTTDKFHLIYKNNDHNHLILKVLPKKENYYHSDNLIFSIKIFHDGKFTNFKSNIGYIVQDEELLTHLEKNAEDIIVQDILNGLVKIINNHNKKQENKIKEILGDNFQLKYKIKNTKISFIKKMLENKFETKDDLYIKDVKIKIENILEVIEKIQSEKEQDIILDEMQNHYIPKIFQSIDLYRSKNNNETEIKNILDAWVESAESKVNITKNKNETILIEDLKISLMAEEKLSV